MFYLIFKIIMVFFSKFKNDRLDRCRFKMSQLLKRKHLPKSSTTH